MKNVKKLKIEDKMDKFDEIKHIDDNPRGKIIHFNLLSVFLFKTYLNSFLQTLKAFFLKLLFVLKLSNFWKNPRVLWRRHVFQEPVCLTEKPNNWHPAEHLQSSAPSETQRSSPLQVSEHQSPTLLWINQSQSPLDVSVCRLKSRSAEPRIPEDEMTLTKLLRCPNSFLARHWLATGGSSSSIGWLPKPLSTVASDWAESINQVSVAIVWTGTFSTWMRGSVTCAVFVVS